MSLSTTATMNTITNASTDPSHIICKCGGDHRGPESHRCPIFEKINSLNKSIKEFLDIQEVVEFGKDGPMAPCLRTIAGWNILHTTSLFRDCEDASEKHPTWHLTGEISRLRSYFDQVSDGCALGEDNSPPRALPEQATDDRTMRDAKLRPSLVYGTCNKVIKSFVSSGAVPVGRTNDHEGYLAKVDKEFKNAVDVILLIEKTDNATMQTLMNQSYEFWKETRRLLCDFKRPSRKSIP